MSSASIDNQISDFLTKHYYDLKDLYNECCITDHKKPIKSIQSLDLSKIDDVRTIYMEIKKCSENTIIIAICDLVNDVNRQLKNAHKFGH